MFSFFITIWQHIQHNFYNIIRHERGGYSQPKINSLMLQWSLDHGFFCFKLVTNMYVSTAKSRRYISWQPVHQCYQGQMEDVVIEGVYRYSIQSQYGHDSTHQDCGQRTFLGSFRHMLLQEDFWDWNSLSEMQSSAFWTIKFSKCLQLSILNM